MTRKPGEPHWHPALCIFLCGHNDSQICPVGCSCTASTSSLMLAELCRESLSSSTLLGGTLPALTGSAKGLQICEAQPMAPPEPANPHRPLRHCLKL